MAAYLNKVKCPVSAKQLWEKRDGKSELEKFIQASVEADKEIQGLSEIIQTEATETKVKEELLSKTDKKRDRKVSKTEKKEKFCFKCGETGRKPKHAKTCKAKKHEYKTCENMGHLEKLCKRAKEKNHLPNSKNPVDQLQLDFWGRVLNEKEVQESCYWQQITTRS